MTYQPKLTNMRGAGDLVEQVTKRTGIKEIGRASCRERV